MKQYDCATCDRKVQIDGDQCPICKRQTEDMKKRARNVEAQKRRKRKVKK